jgi:4-amino-4-deoxy-L-arabinose transferase-like glycosyltransferase
MRLSARALLVGLFVALAAAKAWLAWSLPLFGDEAFYWLESRHLAPAYSDVPPATPALIALGTPWFPGREFGVRLVALLLGFAVPPLVFAWARRFVGDGEARAAAALSMLLPLSAGLGVLALPDVPLTVATLACAITLAHALDSDRWRDWLLFGLALAAGWLSHYRFALIAAAAALFLLGFPRGRAAWRSRGFLAALAIGLLGLAPTLVFNLQHDAAGLRFQFVDRHPWSPHAGALVEPAVQAVLATPVLFVVLCFALWRAWRWRARREAPYDVLAGCAGGLLLLHFALGPLVDAERVRFHWPLPALLLALPLVPGLLREWRERGGLAAASAIACVPLAALGTLALFGVLALATQPAGPGFAPLGRPQPDNLQGWREVGQWAAGLARGLPERTLVADHFMGAAQVAFAVRDARPVFALDHPLNHKHGRAVQLAVMGRDEAALAAGGWREGLLLVEETSRREIDRVPAMLALCTRFGSLRRRDELVLFGGRWRWHAFEVTPPVPGRDARPCELPATADWSFPAPDAVLGVGAQEVAGWAMADFTGVRGLEVLVDGAVRARARYGEPFPGVHGQWPMSRDPHHPDVGFRATLALQPEDRGARVLALRVTEADGRTRVLAQRRITIVDAP